MFPLFISAMERKEVVVLVLVLIILRPLMTRIELTVVVRDRLKSW